VTEVARGGVWIKRSALGGQRCPDLPEITAIDERGGDALAG
jgi:hypothetical protein